MTTAAVATSKKICLCLFVAIISLWIFMRTGNCIAFSETLKEAIACSILGHDTIFSPSYNERSFCGIHAGMSPAEVRTMMKGPPLSVVDHREADTSVWLYSVSPNDTNHWKKAVIFKNGRVFDIIKIYYFD